MIACAADTVEECLGAARSVGRIIVVGCFGSVGSSAIFSDLK